MKRIGKEGEGYEKLASEFEASINKASTMLGGLVDNLPTCAERDTLKSILELNPESFEKLLELFHDLSWVKNWLVDGKELP